MGVTGSKRSIWSQELEVIDSKEKESIESKCLEITFPYLSLFGAGFLVEGKAC
jgi:hypothetical protein